MVLSTGVSVNGLEIEKEELKELGKKGGRKGKIKTK
jgi:hypothetical protein